MLVREVMTCGVEVVHPDTTLEEAAAKMERFDIGLLPVCADDQLLGTLTDRDITVRSVAHGEDPTEDQVRDVMSREVVHCFEDQNVDEAARLMQQKQVRRPLRSSAPCGGQPWPQVDLRGKGYLKPGSVVSGT